MKLAVPGGVVSAIAAALALAVVFGLGGPSGARAASHREAPLIAMDPEADITDFFMFRSYETGQSDKVDLIMDVIPGEEPSSGPNYYTFDPNVLYGFNIDNNKDGKDDVRIEVRFQNEFRGTAKALGLFLPYVALPPITDFNSDGLGLRQTYTVTMIRGHKKTQLAEGLVAVPPNVGPTTMPDYENNLAKHGIYELGNGVRVFAGQRDDPFYIDLAAVFDTLSLRSPGPLLSAATDAVNANVPGASAIDTLAGFNIHEIAIELPASMLTKDGKSATETSQPVLGAYANTMRQRVTVLSRGEGEGEGPRTEGDWVQVQRLANPLVNEAIIGTDDKDHWNAVDPNKEEQFLDYYRNPRLSIALNAVFGAGILPTPRDDLVNLLLKYSPTDKNLSELLRLNLTTPPTTLATQNRLGPFGHDASDHSTPDAAGWPNGRRPIDDVTDIAVRAVGGGLYAAFHAGDGINANDVALPGGFPFEATPWSGTNRVHANP
jgi:hypothetical protein